MSLNLKCYLYRARHQAVERSQQSASLSSATVDGRLIVTVPLMPVGGESRVTIRARLGRPGVNPLACSASDYLVWSDKVSVAGQVRGCNLTGQTPAAPDWINTALSGEFCGPLHNVTPNLHAEDAGPDISDPADSLWYADWTSSIETTAPAPGEVITMLCDYRQNLPYSADDYYSTLALTSGVITDKWEHPNLPHAYIYWVTLEGVSERGELYPTDFLEYQIGDRVAIIKETDESAAMARTPGLLRPARIADLLNSNLRPAPLRFS